MNTTYEYKEKCGIVAKLIWLSAIISPVPCFLVVWIASKENLLNGSFGKFFPVWMVFIVIGNFVIAWIASNFEITIKDGVLYMIFGKGVFRKKIRIKDVKNVQIFQGKFQFGLFGGKRISDNTRLYSIGNKNFVELKLHSGKKIQIGTDQPEELTQAIKSIVS